MRKTYQDLEEKEAERKIEFDSIFKQLDDMEKVIIEMQGAIVSLKHYLKGSICFEEHM
jgi:hypothetical protein